MNSGSEWKRSEVGDTEQILREWKEGQAGGLHPRDRLCTAPSATPPLGHAASTLPPTAWKPELSRLCAGDFAVQEGGPGLLAQQRRPPGTGPGKARAAGGGTGGSGKEGVLCSVPRVVVCVRGVGQVRDRSRRPSRGRPAAQHSRCSGQPSYGVSQDPPFPRWPSPQHTGPGARVHCVGPSPRRLWTHVPGRLTGRKPTPVQGLCLHQVRLRSVLPLLASCLSHTTETPLPYKSTPPGWQGRVGWGPTARSGAGRPVTVS